MSNYLMPQRWQQNNIIVTEMDDSQSHIYTYIDESFVVSYMRSWSLRIAIVKNENYFGFVLKSTPSQDMQFLVLFLFHFPN